MTRKGKSITLSLTPTDKARLEAIAIEFGKMWGDRPNVSKLIEDIARRKIQLSATEELSPFCLQAIYQGFLALLDTGNLEAATELAELLCDRNELPLPQRSEIEQFLHKPIPSWQIQIDQYIRTQQAFQLSFYDFADQLNTYTITYGQIKFQDRVKYLTCRCKESSQNIPITELKHNWNLRLDRISEAVITPINLDWKGNLDQIIIELHLFNSLAFAYEPHASDILVEFINSEKTSRRVLRKISFTQALFEELKIYGENCYLISPKTVQTEFVRSLWRWTQHYAVDLDLPQSTN